MTRYFASDELTILPLARAIKRARQRGVTLEQVATLAEVTDSGGLDDFLDAFDEAELMARSSGLPIRSLISILMREKRSAQKKVN